MVSVSYRQTMVLGPVNQTCKGASLGENPMLELAFMDDYGNQADMVHGRRSRGKRGSRNLPRKS